MTLEEDLSSNVNICPQNKDQTDTCPKIIGENATVDIGHRNLQ